MVLAGDATTGLVVVERILLAARGAVAMTPRSMVAVRVNHLLSSIRRI